LHQKNQGRSNTSVEEETNSQLRRIIIKSVLVILNFVYSKRYLKDTIAGYCQPGNLDAKPSSTDIFGGSKKVKQSNHCVMEDEKTLSIFKDLLF